MMKKLMPLIIFLILGILLITFSIMSETKKDLTPLMWMLGIFMMIHIHRTQKGTAKPITSVRQFISTMFLYLVISFGIFCWISLVMYILVVG